MELVMFVGEVIAGFNVFHRADALLRFVHDRFAQP
jgi:hypothetical protein